jgi:hypothetical protein
MKKYIFIFAIGISCTHVFGQQRVNDFIDFILPPKVDSVLCVLLNHVNQLGLIDNTIILWRECPGVSSVSTYSFYQITSEPEFDKKGAVSNRLLWYKKRTNRMLKISDRFLIPIIFPLDKYSSSGGAVYPQPVIDLNVSEYSPVVQFSPSGSGYLYKNWKFEKDSVGNLQLLISMSMIDTVFLGW